MKDIVIRGSGGSARELALIIEEINMQKKEWNVLGYIDIKDTGMVKYGYEVLDNDTFFMKHPGICCAIAVGDSETRRRIYRELSQYDLVYPNIIHPTCIIAKDAVMGCGNLLFPNSVISVGASIGKFCFISRGSAIGHDGRLGDFVSLMPCSAISGEVQVKDGAFIGVGSIVLQQKSIGENALVGAGSLVIRSVPDNARVFGNPAKRIDV